jgi:hypothetical protein
MEIIFTKLVDFDYVKTPELASLHVPEWYKKIDSYTGGEKIPNGMGQTTATIKRCMPVFDAFSSGYIIFSDIDVFVTLKKFDINGNLLLENSKEPTHYTKQYFEWPSETPISFHTNNQIVGHPLDQGNDAPKWTNSWGIKTPKGYSTMFVQPMHRESVFTILPGIVDTDKYNAPVNFPFVMNDQNWQGLIPAGTPIAQVIPIKREKWKSRIGNKKEKMSIINDMHTLNTKIFDKYKTTFRTPKEYK